VLEQGAIRGRGERLFDTLVLTSAKQKTPGIFGAVIVAYFFNQSS
jgi:hypothetical protein